VQTILRASHAPMRFVSLRRTQAVLLSISCTPCSLLLASPFYPSLATAYFFPAYFISIGVVVPVLDMTFVSNLSFLIRELSKATFQDEKKRALRDLQVTVLQRRRKSRMYAWPIYVVFITAGTTPSYTRVWASYLVSSTAAMGGFIMSSIDLTRLTVSQSSFSASTTGTRKPEDADAAVGVWSRSEDHLEDVASLGITSLTSWYLSGPKDKKPGRLTALKSSSAQNAA
jgi:hypothetical protein